MAAALAYYTLFSLFPLLLLILSIIGYLLDAGWSVATGTREVLVQLTVEVIPAFGDLVNNALDTIQTGRGVSGIIGLLGLVWAASTTFNHLHIALDQIWGLSAKTDLRLTVKRRVISILIVLSLALLLIIAQATKSLVYWLTFITDQLPGGVFLHALMTWIFPFIAAVFTFGFMYQVFPSVKISWRDVWPGAVMAGVGWELLKLIFAIYVAQFADWQAIYGPVASVIGLLTWLYLSFTIILFGAEFAAAFSKNNFSTEPTVENESVQQIEREIDSIPADPLPDNGKIKPPEKRSQRKNVLNLATGLEAGIIGLLATLVISIGLLLKWKSNKTS
ncbi:MAG: YihY/virulence factor BrkB family protein [Anaerolineales bacterium]|nr:YihY/virulence factor BrkB family protein [Anaerolineales bacterium]